jgi:hypothetical protein
MTNMLHREDSEALLVGRHPTMAALDVACLQPSASQNQHQRLRLGQSFHLVRSRLIIHTSPLFQTASKKYSVPSINSTARIIFPYRDYVAAPLRWLQRFARHRHRNVGGDGSRCVFPSSCVGYPGPNHALQTCG